MSSYRLFSRDGFDSSGRTVSSGESIDERLTPFRILIAESDPGRAAAMETVIKEMGFLADLAHTCEEAGRLLKFARYDLVLVDAFLPELGGLSLLAEARITQPAVPVIITAEDFSVDLAARASRFGAADMIQVPCSKKDFCLAVNRALGRSALAPEGEKGF